MATGRAKRQPAKPNGSRYVNRLSALDLENVAQVELCDYFEPPKNLHRYAQITDSDSGGSLAPRPRTRGGRRGLAPAARLFIYPEVRARILFELDRLIRRARLREGRAQAARAREHETRRYSDSEAWDNPEGRKRLKRKIETAHPMPGREHSMTRDSWRLWDSAKPPARETLARWASDAPRREIGRALRRRDIHLAILRRHRRVKREIRELVMARLKPEARPPGRLFCFVYQPDPHRLLLTSPDMMPTA